MKPTRKRPRMESNDSSTKEEQPIAQAEALSTQGIFGASKPQQPLQLQTSPVLMTLLFNIYIELKRRNDLEEEKIKKQKLQKQQESNAAKEEEEKDSEHFKQIAPSIYM